MSDQNICRDQTYGMLKVAFDEDNWEMLNKLLPHALDRLKRLEDYEDAVRNVKSHLRDNYFPQYDPNTGKVSHIVGIKSIREIFMEAGV